MIVATRNEHKLRELREALPGIELEPLPDEVELPPEDGRHLRRQRAGQGARRARGHRPGRDRRRLRDRGRGARRAARASARRATPARARATSRTCRSCSTSCATGADKRLAYVCAIALVGEDGEEELFEGRCDGTLVDPPRGSGGFGYDPAFLPDDTGPGDERTFGELPAAEKHAISHRGRAAARCSPRASGSAP